MDAVSQSMLADFLSIVPQMPAMVLITFRPEYVGPPLAGIAAAQTVALGPPLGDSDTATLLTELLGSDPSVHDLAAVIGKQAAGNPFFAEEMVREMAQRGVLTGARGSYVCVADTTDLSVPVTVQAAISARIDRLSEPAKRTLNAAAVIGGVHFGADLLAALEVDVTLDELLQVELIDQVRFTPTAEYVFRNPLIQAVAYESQLKSDRAVWHRRLATAIEQRAPDSTDENAVLIAEHLKAAGDLPEAYACICVPPHGRPSAMSRQPVRVGRGPDASPTNYPTMYPVDCRSASRRERCCAPPTSTPAPPTKARGGASPNSASCAVPRVTKCPSPSG